MRMLRFGGQGSCGCRLLAGGLLFLFCFLEGDLLVSYWLYSSAYFSKSGKSPSHILLSASLGVLGAGCKRGMYAQGSDSVILCVFWMAAVPIPGPCGLSSTRGEQLLYSIW